MNFTIGLTRNFNDTGVEPGAVIARGQVTLQISQINFFRYGGLRKYESFLYRGQQNNKNALSRIALL